MIIYIDIIFLENIFMNSIILLATGIILKTDLKIIRNFIASTIGSIYAVIIYISNIEIYSNVILKVALSFAMVYIAFKPPNIKLFLKYLIIFYLTSFTFGGVAFALLYFVNPKSILMQDGVLIGTYPIKIILVGGIIGFIIITNSFKNIKGKFGRKDLLCKVILNSEKQDVKIDGIIDTGNLLRDPISKVPVIVVEKLKLEGIFPKIILANISNIINGKDIELGELSAKIRAIPFKSLGKENGLILGIKMDEIQVEYQDDIHKIENAIIGIYNGNLSRNGKYFALVGIDAIN